MSRLREILEHKRAQIERAKETVPLADLEDAARRQTSARGFKRALIEGGRLALIAEVKAASPSKGPIRPGLDAGAGAAEYESAGANALSVLTDERFFAGSAQDLVGARRRTGLPVLRKDFVLDPYQIVESRAIGADAVLLIVAALERPLLRELLDAIRAWEMDALTEVHDEAELEIALHAGCDIVGVNNRDLGTLQTDLGVAERLLPLVPPSALAVAESALETREDVERMRRAGARAVLIGTAFCSAPHIGLKVREVMGW
jgi:indole-3-glycerol phosphate synthase